MKYWIVLLCCCVLYGQTPVATMTLENDRESKLIFTSEHHRDISFYYGGDQKNIEDTHEMPISGSQAVSLFYNILPRSSAILYAEISYKSSETKVKSQEILFSKEDIPLSNTKELLTIYRMDSGDGYKKTGIFFGGSEKSDSQRNDEKNKFKIVEIIFPIHFFLKFPAVKANIIWGGITPNTDEVLDSFRHMVLVSTNDPTSEADSIIQRLNKIRLPTSETKNIDLEKELERWRKK